MRYGFVIFCALLVMAGCGEAAARDNAVVREPVDSIADPEELDEVVITKKMASTRKLKHLASNTELISATELRRAACCNLGESFTTNPSVDVNYSDAATGARQIKLLGLPGTYVQMMNENVPNLRGASAAYGLSYIPGPWMQSIQVSKGASSVKNGYESVTGQINIELLKPQVDQSVSANAYIDHTGRLEGNAMGNVHLNSKWSTGLLLHGENSFATHDKNGDTFADNPKIRQFSAMNRWAFFSDKYIFQAAVKYLDERREGGQTGHGSHGLSAPPYLIDIRTHRGEVFAKNAYIFDNDNGANIALILSGSIHDQKSAFGHRIYNVNQKNYYASLMFERNFGEYNSLSTGLSINADDYDQHYRLVGDPTATLLPWNQNETTPGAYAQYTYNYRSQLILMGGLRYDHSSVYGSMVTPRVHLRYTPSDAVSIHASAGRGYRSPYALADNANLLASSRTIVIDDNLRQESAWNFGGGLSGTLKPWDRTLSWNVEYYYTTFQNRTDVDLDANPNVAYIRNVEGRSFSHAFQVETTFEILSDLSLTAAYRYTDSQVDFGRGLTDKPLSSKSKGLVSVAYTPMMGIWAFDVTLALTGGGRMPTPSVTRPLWSERYKGYPTLNAQITRNFRHWSVYLGGENLTNYRQPTPVIGANDPWGADFDATMVYGPINGAMVYAGFRYTFTKY